MEKTFIKPTVKGQITIPYKMRQKLGINENTLIQIVLEKDSFVSIPVKVESPGNLYSQLEIDEFLANDEISEKDASFYKELLKS